MSRNQQIMALLAKAQEHLAESHAAVDAAMTVCGERLRFRPPRDQGFQVPIDPRRAAVNLLTKPTTEP